MNWVPFSSKQPRGAATFKPTSGLSQPSNPCQVVIQHEPSQTSNSFEVLAMVPEEQGKGPQPSPEILEPILTLHNFQPFYFLENQNLP